MTNLLTVTQAAARLNVSSRRIRAMLQQSCPVCVSENACPRCRGTAHKLPHVEVCRSGRGVIRLVYAWALALPDVANQVRGQPAGVPGVTAVKGKRGYDVLVGDKVIGAVWRVSKAKRSWSNGGKSLFRSRKESIRDLVGIPSQSSSNKAAASACLNSR